MVRAQRPLVAAVATVAAARIATTALRPRSPVPTPPRGARPGAGRGAIEAESYFTADQLHRVRRYRRPQALLGAGETALQLAVLWRLARRRPAAPATTVAPGEDAAPPVRAPSVAERHPVLAGALAGATTLLATGAAPLPLAALARHRAVRAGLATGTWRLWASDLARAAALEAAAGAALGAGTVALVRRDPTGWWRPAAGVGVGASAALTFAAPLLIEPLFSRSRPVEDEELVADLRAIAGRAGVRLRAVLVSDASRRTTAVNAYVSGFGRSRRVVFWDTLLEGFGARETRMVVAHELSHVVHRDVPRSLVFLALVAAPAAAATAALAELLTPDGAGAPGRTRSGDPLPVSVPAVLLAGAAAGLLPATEMARLSRAIERRADAEALGWTGDPGALIGFFQRIAVTNVGDPDPRGAGRLLHDLLGTHPTVLERIGAAVAHAETHGIALPPAAPVVALPAGAD
jgi:STE24 endopeptidase